MMNVRFRSLERVVANVIDLPALPTVVSDVLNITEDPTSAISELSEHIQRDPALTAKILKVSNSPYYGMRQYVGTLKLALVVLGVREIRNIVLGISVFEAISNHGIDAAFSNAFRDHAVKVGGLSKKLGVELALGLQGEDFIAGLLHDVGKMVLLRWQGPSYLNILNASGGHSERLCSREFTAYGYDHADVAFALAGHWNLPHTLADAMWCHHPGEDRSIRSAKDPKLAALVRIANAAANEDFSQGDANASASCTDEEAWSALATPPPAPASRDGRRNLLAGFTSELDQAQEPGA